MSQDLSPQEIEKRLWDEIDQERFGMLGVGGHHMQPMTMFASRGEGRIWFFTKKNTDLVHEAGAGAQAMLCIMSKDQEFQACVAGKLSEDYNRNVIDQYWSQHVAAWFPEGKDDPQLTLLRLDTQDAQVWISKRGPLKYLYEVNKANLTGSEPNVGQRAEIRLG